MEVMIRCSVMLPWVTVGVWTSTAMNFMKQGKKEHLTAATLTPS